MWTNMNLWILFYWNILIQRCKVEIPYKSLFISNGVINFSFREYGGLSELCSCEWNWCIEAKIYSLRNQRAKSKMGSVGLTAMMVAVECLEMGSTTVSKAAMNGGMSHFIFVFYSNALAAIFILLPSSLIFYRKRSYPPVSLSIICRIFLLGLIGCFVQTCTYTGIGLSSPSLASAINDLIPAFTFILALITRMEKLNLRVKSGQAKFIGTMASIAGALTLTLYNGPAITNYSSSNNLQNNFLSSQTHWVAGGLVLATGSFFLSLLYIVQTWIIKDYPEELMVTFICCIFVTIQSAAIALITERNLNAWMLKPDLELVAIGYSAVVVIVLRSLIHTWACHKKGPVYVSMFKPLGIVIAVIMGISFLGDTLYLGSVIGAAIIAIGFYSVLWGKAQEEKMEVDDKRVISSFESSSSSKVPLLVNKSNMEV